jgi:hypothetical protein
MEYDVVIVGGGNLRYTENTFYLLKKPLKIIYFTSKIGPAGLASAIRLK